MDSGSESIADDAERAQVRRQAMKVHAQSLATALALTALVFVLP